MGASAAAWPSSEHAEIAETYRTRLAFQGFYEQPEEQCRALACGLGVETAVTYGGRPIEDFACSIAEHWDGGGALDPEPGQHRRCGGHLELGPGGQTQCS